MSNSETITDLPERLAAVVVAALQTDKGVHAETAIATAAVLTGEYALRASGIDFSTLKPGAPIFNEAVNRLLFEAEGALTISDVFINALFAQGIDVSKQSWPEQVPEDHQIMMDPLQVAMRIRPHINNVFAAHETIDLLERSYQCASATALLVAQTRRVLDPDIGKALALEAMLKGAKTVPF